MFKIYIIENDINKKKYVGQTIKELKARWCRHCWQSEVKKNMPITSAIKKYGKTHFTIREIDSANSLEEANQKEIYWANFYNCFAPNGYNLRAGGRLYCVTSEETKRKISLANLGRKASEETRKRLSESHKGFKVTDKTKQKLSKIFKGQKAHEASKSAAKLKNKKICIFVSPSGEEVEVVGILEFGKRVGICASSISKLCRGKISSCKGWKLKYNKGYNR